jgi:hypothetical protein
MFDKIIPDETLKKFKLYYNGGCILAPEYPMGYGINFFVTQNSFVMRSAASEYIESHKKKPFLPIHIPYDDVFSCEAVQLRYSVVGFTNEIHISCVIQENPCTIRVKSRKLTYMGVHNETQKIIDFLHENNIFSKFRQPFENISPQSNITVQIQQLADLHKQGILTDEEFQAKKTELLERI